MQKGKPSKKYSQAGRLHNVIRLLETRQGMTIDDLAEECGVDRRTIHRDINAVQEAGYPLIAERTGGKKIYRFITKSRSLPPITFTLNELMSLYLLRSLGEYVADTPFHTDISELFNKITATLPDRSAAHLERISRVSLPLLQGARDYSSFATQIDELRRGLLFQYRMHIVYAKKNRGKGDEYEVDPYTLVFHKGGIYLLGYAHTRKAMRLFALERIQNVQVSRHRFEIPEQYHPEDHFNAAFGLVTDRPMQVKVRFSESIAHIIRGRLWHPGQTMEEDDKGNIIISFRASGEMEIISWILSYGCHAEALEPPELRREIKRHVRGMRDFYRTRDKKTGREN